MKLKSSPETHFKSSLLRSRILALLTALAPMSCSPAIQGKPAALSAEQERELVVAELLEAIDVPREGIQPNGKSYVLCRQAKGETKIPFEMTTDAIKYLFRATGRSINSFDPNKVDARSLSKDDWHCIRITLKD